MKNINVNYGVKNYLKEEHHSCIRNSCSCEKFFFRLSFRNCMSCVYNFDALPSNNNFKSCQKPV